MSAALPTGRRGRLLAVSLALAVLASFYAAVVSPLIALYAANEVAAETRRMLVWKLDAVSRELPVLRSRMAKLRAAAAVDTHTLGGASDAVASAALQGRIGEIASTAGVAIASAESLPTEVQDGHRRVGLKLAVNGSYQGLIDLLAGLERTAPPLVVDNLQIRSSHQRLRGPVPPRSQAAAEQVPALNASFEVYGFRIDETAEIAKR